MLVQTAWEENDVIREAVDIQKGRIRFNKIISYQRREKEYPHTKIISDTLVEYKKHHNNNQAPFLSVIMEQI